MKKLLLIAVSALTIGLGAQTGYFQVPGSNTGNPGTLNSEAEYPPGGGLAAGWSTVVTGPQSKTWSAAQNIPFTFKFNDATVTQLKIGSTGVVTFDVASSVACPSAVPATLPSTSIPDKSVVVWGVEAKSTGDFVVTKTFGTAPNRQFWIQYSSCSEANLLNGWAYMAIVLEETSNHIYIVDQRSNCVDGTTACSNKTKLTLGIQIDGSNALSVTGSPNYQMLAGNDPTTADNYYYEFAPGSLADDDATMISVNQAPYLKNMDAPFVVKFSVKNTGGKAITAVNATYTINGANPVTEDISGSNIASGSNGVLSFATKWTPSGLGKFTIAVTVNSVNSTADNFGLNTKSVDVNVVDKFAPRKILNEIFTSSTCGPCTAGNANYLKVTEGQTKHSTIKYQVSWPGTGDPYCTQEVRDRVGLYAINSVPRMEVDGGWDGNASSFTTALYDQFNSKPAFLEITGNVSLTWKNNVSADITLTPLADFNSSNLKLHAVITEGTTYWNKKSNGETQFEDVMKKMITTSAGMTLSPLVKDAAVNKNVNFAFVGNYRLPANGTAAEHIDHTKENSVETWNDLAVVVFVQDATTKEVLQSETFPIALTGVETLEQGINLYPNPANDMFNLNVASMANEKATVTVSNIKGQVLYTGSLVNGKTQINVANMVEGMYIVNISAGSKNLNTKMVVRH